MSTLLLLLALVGWPVQASQTGSTAPVAVGGKILPPTKTKNVAPTYPRDAQRAGAMGVVILECTISPKGEVVDARVLRGSPLLSDAAVEAVLKWRYTPTLLEGVAVPVIMTVTVRFHLARIDVPDLIASLNHPNEELRGVAAANLGWVGKAHRGTKVMRDAVQALEQAVAKDPSPEVRGVATRALSRIDGRPLVGQPPAEPEASQPNPLVTAALGGFSRPVAWGDFIDPSGDCEIKAQADRVEIGLPAGTYDLSAELGRVTAPRLVRPVDGDLTAQVTVDELPRPKASGMGPASQPFHGAGLLLWQDTWNYVRFEAAVYLGTLDLLVRYALFEVRVGGKLVGGRAVADFRLNDGPTDLRLELRGGEIVALAKQGSGKWKRVDRAVLKPPGWIALGVSATNVSAAPLPAGFSGFEVVRGAIVEPQAATKDDALAPTTTDSPPKPIRSPRPNYPQAAFIAGIEGTVVVEALIDSKGRVTRTRVIRSVEGLDEAALFTVSQWLFEPASKNGEPVPTLAQIPIVFWIDGKEK